MLGSSRSSVLQGAFEGSDPRGSCRRKPNTLAAFITRTRHVLKVPFKGVSEASHKSEF